MPIYRGEIYFVELGPVRGREMNAGKTRPVVVLSINFLNNLPLVVVVVPGTSRKPGKRIDYKNVVLVPATSGNGLNSETVFLCHQIRALDHDRFKYPPVGRLSA